MSDRLMGLGGIFFGGGAIFFLVGGTFFWWGGLFFGGLFGCRAVFRYFPHQLRFGHPLGGFTVNRAFFTIFRQAEGGGRRAVFTRGHFFCTQIQK